MSAANRWAILIISTLFIAFHRLWWVSLPLERDISTYAVIARGLLEGRSLYSDLWDHKPPGIHITYTIGAVIFGSTQLGITLLGITLSAITGLIIWQIGALLFPSVLLPRAVATLCYSLIQGDLFIEAVQPNTEAGINLFVALAFYWLLKLKATPHSTIILALLAISTLAASSFKHVAVIPIFAATIGILPKQLWFRSLGAIGLALALGWGIILAIVPGAFDALIGFNRHYSGSLIENLQRGLDSETLLHRSIALFLPLLALALPAIWRTKWLLFTLVGCWFAVSLPGRFYNHYFQLYIPALCIAAGIGAHCIQISMPRLGFALVAVVLGLLATYQIGFMALFTPESYSLKRHGGIYLHSQQLGERLKASGVSFELVGDSTGVLFYSQATPRSGVVYTIPRDAGDFTQNQDMRLLSDLRRSNPPILISELKNPLFATNSGEATSELITFLKTNFSPCPNFYELAILRRNDANCPSY